MTTTHRITRRWALGLSAAALTTAMLATGGLAASAAPLPTSATTTTASATECTFGEHLVKIWTDLPAQLQSDLKDLKAATPGAQRLAEAKQIRDDALSGAYGEKVQKYVQNAKGHPLARLATMPDALKADLEALKNADPADRPALAKSIADKALAGDYGTAVQTAAKRIQNSPEWQACTK